jgi:hypothetical protein
VPPHHKDEPYICGALRELREEARNRLSANSRRLEQIAIRT